MMVVIYNEVNKNLLADMQSHILCYKNLARFFYVEYTKKEYKQKSTEETGELYE